MKLLLERWFFSFFGGIVIVLRFLIEIILIEIIIVNDYFFKTKIF